MSDFIKRAKTIGWVWVVFCLISFISGTLSLALWLFGEQQLYIPHEQLTLVATFTQVILMVTGVVGGIGLIKRKEWGRKLVIFLSLIFIISIIGYEIISYVNDVVLGRLGWQWIWYRTVTFLILGVIPLSLCCLALKKG